MKKFPWKVWLELWLETAWLPLMLVYLIVAPFGETEHLGLALWFILQGIFLGGALSLWAIVYAARKSPS